MKAIEFISNNWEVLSPVFLLIISEIMALNPKWKGNGILQGIATLIKKKNEK